MKKSIAIALGIALLVGGYFFFKGSNKPLGNNSETNNITEANEFNQVGLTASRSIQGVISAIPARMYAVEVTSDSTSLRYLQLFNMVASTSQAVDTQITSKKPVGSYKRYASPSLVMSIPIPAATSSGSPTIVRLENSTFSPARYFSQGIIFAISSVFGSYSSASITSANTARFTVKVIYR